MITLTLTEAFFWAITFISLPLGYVFITRFVDILRDIQRLNRRVENIGGFTDELSERLHRLEQPNRHEDE